MSEAEVTAIGIGIQTVLYLLGAFALFMRNESKQKINAENLGHEVRDMKEELKGLAKVITEQAVQTTRIDNLQSQVTMLQQNVEDMRRGAGWVTRRKELDGEYNG